MFDIPRQLPAQRELQITPSLEDGEHNPRISCEGERVRVDFIAHVSMDLALYERLMLSDFPPIYPLLSPPLPFDTTQVSAHLSATPDLES